jgi:hypothetical protein
MRGMGGKWTFCGYVDDSIAESERATKGIKTEPLDSQIYTVGTVPPSTTNSEPWIAAARSEAR